MSIEYSNPFVSVYHCSGEQMNISRYQAVSLFHVIWHCWKSFSSVLHQLRDFDSKTTRFFGIGSAKWRMRRRQNDNVFHDPDHVAISTLCVSVTSSMQWNLPATTTFFILAIFSGSSQQLLNGSTFGLLKPYLEFTLGSTWSRVVDYCPELYLARLYIQQFRMTMCSVRRA